MERTLVGIDFVESAENQAHLDVDHFIACQEATLHRVLDSLLNRLDVLAWNGATGNFVYKNKTLAGRRLDLQFNVRVLTTTTCLLLEDLLARGRLRNGFAIGNLRLAHIGLDTELSLHAIDDDLEVQLTHAGYDGLAGFLIS